MKPPKTAWLITPQAPQVNFHSPLFQASEDLVIAIDGGLQRCVELNLKADYLCGDLDSVAPDLIQTLKPEQIWGFPSRKDETDTELAIIKAMELGIRRIIILNTMQGRTDHILGLIQNLCFGFLKGLDISIETTNQRIFFLPEIWEIKAHKGCLISLIAYGGDAIFSSSEGLSWSLQGLVLSPHLSRGISNVITCNHASIKVLSGHALAVLTKRG